MFINLVYIHEFFIFVLVVCRIKIEYARSEAYYEVISLSS